MRKTFIVGASLLLVMSGTVTAGAYDFTDHQAYEIASQLASTPAISAGGGQFFPVVNTMKVYGTTDITGAMLLNGTGTAMDMDQMTGVISGDVTYKDLYSLSWADPIQSMPVPVILAGPMNVGHINFASASATLDSNDKAILEAVAKEMVKTGLTAAYLVGRADPVGSDAGNFAISLKRVNAAANYLDSYLHVIGVTDARITTEYMGSIGATGAEDRRVDITIYPKI